MLQTLATPLVHWRALYRLVVAVARDGAFIVQTPRPPSSRTFETRVYLDGDIVAWVPDPAEYDDRTEWRAAASRHHQELLAQLSELDRLAWIPHWLATFVWLLSAKLLPLDEFAATLQFNWAYALLQVLYCAVLNVAALWLRERIIGALFKLGLWFVRLRVRDGMVRLFRRFAG